MRWAISGAVCLVETEQSAYKTLRRGLQRPQGDGGREGQRRLPLLSPQTLVGDGCRGRIKGAAGPGVVVAGAGAAATAADRGAAAGAAPAATRGGVAASRR